MGQRPPSPDHEQSLRPAGYGERIAEWTEHTKSLSRQTLREPGAAATEWSDEECQGRRFTVRTVYGVRPAKQRIKRPENLVTMLKNCPDCKCDSTAEGALTVRRTASPMIGSTESTWLSNSREARFFQRSRNRRQTKVLRTRSLSVGHSTRHQ